MGRTKKHSAAKDPRSKKGKKPGTVKRLGLGATGPGKTSTDSSHYTKRSRPAEFVAPTPPKDWHRRFDATPTRAEMKDTEFIPPKSLTGPSTTQRRSLRSQARIFFNCANALVPLPPGHQPDEEAIVFRKFEDSVMKISPVKTKGNFSYYETDHSFWIPTIIRYTNKNHRDNSVKRSADKEFWKTRNGSPTTIALTTRDLLKIAKKPVALLLGTGDFNSEESHCVVIVIIPTSDGLRGIVKDSKSVAESRVNTLAYCLFKDLGIPTVEVVGMLDTEEAVSYSDCIREALKTVGDILDGNQFWQRDLSLFTIKYSATTYEMIGKRPRLYFSE